MVKRIILFFVVFFGSATVYADDIFQTWGISVTQERITGHVQDFRNQLQEAWQLKCSRKCTDEAKDMAARAVQRYPKHPKALSLGEYISFMDREASRVKKGIQWNDLQKHYRLSDEQNKFLIDLTEKIHGRELAAYALTEIMPSKNGILNREALATLLTHAGQEYIELLPAIYDQYVSFGPFQPTQFALYEGVDEFRGASVTNTFISDKSVKIPGSVARLKGGSHYRMAMLFAIDNLAHIAKYVDTGFNVATVSSNSVTGIVACSHHAPSACRSAAIQWINGGSPGMFSIEEPALSWYVEKTMANYQALRGY